MRLLLHKLSKLSLLKKKYLKKINSSGLLFGLIVFLIFIQILILNPTEITSRQNDSKNNDSQNLKTAEQIQNLARSKSTSKAVEQKMKGIHLVENLNKLKGWELFAEEATGSSDAQWVLKKVKVEFFAEDQSSYTVTGDVGEIDGLTKNILIRGQVITTSTNGYLFKTNDLRFVAENKSLISDDSVDMTGPADQSGSGFALNGIGFKIDLNKNEMSILQTVQAHKVIDKKNFDVNSERAFFSNKNQEGQFLGSVILKYDKTHITAPQAFFKYSNSEKKLKTILLKDKVVLKEFEKSATCKELEFDLENDKMTLRGSPKVQMKDDELTGEEIIFLDNGQKVKVNNVKVMGKIQ